MREESEKLERERKKKEAEKKAKVSEKKGYEKKPNKRREREMEARTLLSARMHPIVKGKALDRTDCSERADVKPGEREHPSVISGSAGQHLFTWSKNGRHADRVYSAPTEPRTEALPETNVQNMNLVTVPKLGGKNTSTCQSTLWSPGRGYYVGATLRYTCSSSWVHASRGEMATNVLSPRITTAFGYLCDLKLFGPEESHQRLGTVEAKLKIQDCQLPYNLIPLLPGRKQLKSNEVH